MEVENWLFPSFIMIIGIIHKIYVLIPIGIVVMGILIWISYIFNNEHIGEQTSLQLVKSLLWEP